MATAQSSTGENRTTAGTMDAHGLDGVLGTGGFVAAAKSHGSEYGREDRRDDDLIHAQRPRQKILERIHFSDTPVTSESARINRAFVRASRKSVWTSENAFPTMEPRATNTKSTGLVRQR